MGFAAARFSVFADPVRLRQHTGHTAPAEDLLVKKIVSVIVLAAIAAVGVVLYQYGSDRLPEPLPPARVAAPVAGPVPVEPEVHHRLATDSAADELPPVDGSDALMRETLAGLWGERVLEQLFNLKGF